MNKRISLTASALLAAALLALPLAAPAQASAPTKSYPLSQVKKHNTTSDCWSIVNGRVYNLSRYLNKHPGGVPTIKPICGKDGTSAFSGQHRGDSAVASVLNPYKIGTLR